MAALFWAGKSAIDRDAENSIEGGRIADLNAQDAAMLSERLSRSE
jgi:hypothetical protein